MPEGFFGPLYYVSLVVATLVAIIFHEISHGVVALWMGDRTARDAGRLSLNPIRHVHPVGTIILPGILILTAALGVGSGVVFGYAKPVPIDSSKLNNPRHQLLAISLAGPLTNVVLALIGGLLLRVVGVVESIALLQIALPWVLVNVFIAAFNLLPFPPLDGSEIMAWLLPGKARVAFRSAERFAMPVLLVLVLVFPRLFFGIVEPLATWLLGVVLA
jgi:Zn-dependent protease